MSTLSTAHPLHCEALPAFNDNYIWLLHQATAAWVVDPGDADVVEQALSARGLSLEGVLLTHHHADHTGGVEALRLRHAPLLWGPAGEALPDGVSRVSGGERLEVLGHAVDVLATPGHTAGHVSYCVRPERQSPLLFCGDTLFSGGCGRLFEGSPAQMLDSLSRLAHLPDDTWVCGAHEYTLSNLRFALAVEPDNLALQHYHAHCVQQRQQGLPTLPSRMGLERQINPFLRSEEASVIRAVQQQITVAPPIPATAPIAVWATLREWKNQFH